MKKISFKRLQTQEKESNVVTGKKTKVKTALSSKTTIVANPDVEAKTPTGRPERVPLAQQFKLSIPAGIKEEGFVYRFIRDYAERVEAFEGAWWEPVKDGAGRHIRKASGMSGYLLLYKIEQKYYDQDLAIKRKKPISLLTEKAKLSKSDRYSSEYVPEGQNSVVTINH